MKQLLVEVDEELAAQLERVAPARSRKRSKFVREALRKALWEVAESHTRAAYRAQPESAEEAFSDAAAWEPEPPKRQSNRGGRRS
jgi:metal-responsive CopG/Arc/MetJ family transcriptional regulator